MLSRLFHRPIETIEINVIAVEKEKHKYSTMHTVSIPINNFSEAAIAAAQRLLLDDKYSEVYVQLKK